MARRRLASLLLVTCLGHVLLISAQVQSQSGLPVLESAAFGLFARIQGLVAGTADGGRSLWTHYFALRGAARENEALRGRLLQLEWELQEQRALANRARALEDALGLRQAQQPPTLAARVIAGNPSPDVLTVTIDRGAADGLVGDMAVIGSAGVIGRVIGPMAPRAARVQLLVDRNAGVAVVFETSGAGGMVFGGSAAQPLRADLVPLNADIQPGERVETSGQDGIYPAGFLVGTVDQVSGSGAEREITVRPAVDFSHLDIVLVVLDAERP
jgi:rod shape-determining protein MreC